MSARGPAVLLDAMGTLVELEPPAPHLVAELAARGVAVGEADAARAVRAEIAFYRAEHDMAVDAASLAELRRRCAAVVAGELGGGLPLDLVLEALLGAIRFRPYPEVPRALAGLRARGRRLAVVSNWDVSLHDVLERTGLRELVDAVVVSATAGAAKPAAAIFEQALARLDADRAGALHVGDDLDADVAGARAAGIEAVLLVRDGALAPPGVRAIASLEELVGPEAAG